MLNYRSLDELWRPTAEFMINRPTGVPLPWWPRFSDLLGGLMPHQFTTWLAPTGAGKTQAMANISAQLLLSKVPHFVAPVETGDLDFVIRVISALERKDYNQGESHSIEAVQGLHKKYEKLIAEHPLYISTHDNRVEVEEMLNTLKYMHQEYGVRVAILDNLQFFLKITSAQMERAEMDSAVHEFAMLAKKLPMHVILIVHPRKTLDGRVESEFDAKGSSSLPQESSNVILWNRPTLDDVRSGRRQITDRELTFRKIRLRGHNFGKTVWFKYNQGRLEEYVK